jgi:hypothetical protein
MESEKNFEETSLKESNYEGLKFLLKNCFSKYFNDQLYFIRY